MRRSLNSTMGEALVASNKQAYSGHRELPIAPDAAASGAYARRRLLNDPHLRVLRGSIFYPYNPCVPRSGTRAKKTQGFNDFNVLNESAAGGR